MWLRANSTNISVNWSARSKSPFATTYCTWLCKSPTLLMTVYLIAAYLSFFYVSDISSTMQLTAVVRLSSSSELSSSKINSSKVGQSLTKFSNTSLGKASLIQLSNVSRMRLRRRRSLTLLMLSLAWRTGKFYAHYSKMLLKIFSRAASSRMP